MAETPKITLVQARITAGVWEGVLCGAGATAPVLSELHGGWEFEASRHFAAAMREDPECLLAHWGMIMALLNPSPETNDARIAATDRLYGLIEQGRNGVGATHRRSSAGDPGTPARASQSALIVDMKRRACPA